MHIFLFMYTWLMPRIQIDSCWLIALDIRCFARMTQAHSDTNNEAHRHPKSTLSLGLWHPFYSLESTIQHRYPTNMTINFGSRRQLTKLCWCHRPLESSWPCRRFGPVALNLQALVAPVILPSEVTTRMIYYQYHWSEQHHLINSTVHRIAIGNSYDHSPSIPKSPNICQWFIGLPITSNHRMW